MSAQLSRRSVHSRRLLWLVSATVLVTLGLAGDTRAPNMAPYQNPSGSAQTFNTAGAIDMAAPFFQDLGSNGRTCASCHQASDGWSVVPAHVQQRFLITQGMDPVFRPVDGANCPSADVSSLEARQIAYSMLLDKGLLRVSLPVPENADFQVVSATDAFNCPETTTTQLALFRRPLPATNLPFLTTVMWDGRESFAGNTLEQNLRHQAIDATTGHAQGQVPTDAQVQAIVDFEMRNFTAQGGDNSAGHLGAQGATGGPVALSSQNFFVGINDPLGTGPFNASAFNIFDNWATLKSGASDPTNSARASIARGQALFNTFPVTISGVAGLNDKPGVPASFTGSCTTCHNAPNVGNHSVALAINIGVADYPAVGGLDISGLPIYTIECHGKTIQTTDPARALITGKCSDIGKTKGPILRGLAARAPYFHNGSAATLNDVLNFYEMRFGLTFSAEQKKDLIAFLNSL